MFPSARSRSAEDERASTVSARIAFRGRSETLCVRIPCRGRGSRQQPIVDRAALRICAAPARKACRFCRCRRRRPGRWGPFRESWSGWLSGKIVVSRLLFLCRMTLAGVCGIQRITKILLARWDRAPVRLQRVALPWSVSSPVLLGRSSPRTLPVRATRKPVGSMRRGHTRPPAN